ncbi:MAG: LamG-like jellyroll fold domain-containing protein [Bacteroidota bacterium]
MKLNFYPNTKLTLTSLKKFFALSLLTICSFNYAHSQAPGTALAFDGLSSIVSVPANINNSPVGSLNISSNITLEAWIYPTSSSGVQDVLCKSSSSVNNGYIFPRTINGWRNVQFLLNINGYGWQTLEVPYGLTKLNKWHHLAATYDGYTMTIYIDGVLAGTKSFAGTITTNGNPLAIGGHTGLSEYFSGKVDEARIWNRALTPCEINNNLTCELPAGQNGLVGYYKFNQGVVNLPNPLLTTLNDESGFGNNGTLNGFLLTGLLSNWATGTVSGTCNAFSPATATASATNTVIPIGSDINLFATGGGTYSWTGPNGFTSTQQNPVLTGVGLNASGVYTVTVNKNGCTATASITITVASLGGALNFNGEMNVVVVPNKPNLNPTTGLTVETWIKPTSASPIVQNVISKSNTTTNTGYIFPRTDDGWRSFSFWLDINGEWRVVSAQLPALNQWNHVAATYDGFYMKIYLNGSLVGTQAAAGTVIYNNNDLTFGIQQGATEFYKGSVDETRIWSRPLAQCEIQNNLYCELNGANNGIASQTGLSAYFRYNQGLVNVANSSYTTLADSSGNNNNGTLQGFALTGASSNWTDGTVNATCSQFAALQAVAGSNGPNIEVGGTINLTASAGTSWSWVGPNSFTSSQRNPSIPNAGINASGTYTVSISGGGCTSSASTNVTVAYRAGTLSFDGVNDKVVVPHNASQDIAKTITIESWVYPTNHSQQVQDVMSKSTMDVNSGYIFPRTDDGWNNFVFYLHINGQFQKLSAPFPGINQWHHVAATYDGYYMRIYLDGVLANSKLMAGDITVNGNDLVLGSQPGFGEFYGGKVEESRIWNRALNQCEIINNMNCELDPAQKNGLVAYYKYNQGFVDANNADVPTLLDASDNANNGTLTNFALQGSVSNWSTFKVNSTCILYTQPPVTAISNASVFGVGSTIQLFANGGITYTWDGPNGFQSSNPRPVVANAQVAASGTYTVTAPFVNCVVTASTRLVVSPLDPIVANGPTTFCPSSSVDLSIANTGIYQWFKNDVLIPNATAAIYTATQSGDYTVSVTTSTGDVLLSAPISLSVVDNLAPVPDVPVLGILHVVTPATIVTIPTATDNCKGTIAATTTSPLTYNTPGNYTITWAYDDGNGHVVYQDQQVVVVLGQDIVPPVLALPAAITANALVETGCGAVVNFAATATDNSGLPVSISYSQNPGTVFAGGNTIVTVTAIDASNNITTGSFTVTVLPTTVSAVTGTASVCAGSTTTLSSATTGGIWSSDNINVATVDASGVVTGLSAGTATIIYTNACGATASAAVTVKAKPSSPSIAINNNCGNTVLTASGITGVLAWSTGASTLSVTVQAGSYTAVQTVNGCVSDAAAAIATPNAIPSAPVVTISNNCGSTILSAAGITGNLAWSTGETTTSIVVGAGTYTATQTVNGCVSAVAIVTAIPKAIPSAPVVTVADNCGSTTLTASGVTGNLIWSTGETTASIVVATGSYTATQTVNGCISAAATVTAAPKTIPSAPVVTVSNNCGSTILTASNVTSGLAWSTGAVTPSITVGAGTYTATQTVNGCVSTAATVTAAPKAIPSAPVVAVSDNCGSTTLTASGVTGNLTWSTGETSASIVVAAGTYTATQTVNGCVSDLTTATAAPKTVPSTPDVITTNNCGSTTISTNATGNYLWSNGATTASINITTAGTYSVKVTNAAGCFANSASTSVTVNIPPVVAAITGATVVTAGSTIQLSNATPNGVWSSNSANATVNAAGLVTGVTAGNATINYTVTVNNCTVTVNTVITVQPNCVAPAFTTTTPNMTANTASGSCTAAVPYNIAASGTSLISYSYAFSGATTGNGSGTGTGASFNAGITTVVVTASNGCGSITTSFTINVKDVTAPNAITKNITVYLDASGVATITPSQVDNGSNDNCGPVSLAFNTATTSGAVTTSSLSFNCAKLGANTVTLNVTDAAGNVSAKTAVVTVQDNTAPVITGTANQSFCNTASTYTIPAITATDNCSIASITYAVTGATNRTGTGLNATGSFNNGVSTITWTVTDASGKISTASETVTIGGGPVATIAVSTADACSNVTLIGNSSVSNPAYKWMLGSTTVSTAQQLSLSKVDTDGIYQLFVTANGCTSPAAVYTYQKQNLIGSYTILAYDEVEIGQYNKVVSGSIGIMSSKGEAEFDKYSSVTGAGSFVKAPRIERNGSGINIANAIYGIATVTLPTMQYNTASTNKLPNYTVSQNTVTTLSGNYKKLAIRKGASVTLTGDTFGTIDLESGASVKFTNAVLNIEDLIVEDGAKDGYYSYIRFAPGSSVRIADKVSIGSQVIVNPDYNNVTFYMGNQNSGGDDDEDEQFTVEGGNTKVIANIFMPNGKLKVTATDDNSKDHDTCDHKAHASKDCKHNSHGHKYCDHKAHNSSDCNDNVYMIGLFIAESVESEGNIVIWSSFDCGSTAIPVVTKTNTVVTQTVTGEGKTTVAETTTEELKITVMPNPSTTYFTLKFESKYETPVNMRVMDASGRVVDAKTKMGSNSTIQIGANYASGTYYAEITQGTVRKVIQLIKVRG